MLRRVFPGATRLGTTITAAFTVTQFQYDCELVGEQFWCATGKDFEELMNCDCD